MCCKKCGIEKPESEFRLYNKIRGWRRRTCRECDKPRINAASRRYAAANRKKATAYKLEWSRKNRGHLSEYRKRYHRLHPEVRRNRDLKRAYGITLAEYTKLFEEQGCRCAICNTDAPQTKHKWHTDHDHATGHVRGILCSHCNVMLGQSGESINTLSAAIEYLRRRCVIP